MQWWSRRQFLQATATATAVAVAGCNVDEEDTEVRAVEAVPSDLSDRGGEPIEVRVLVYNVGAATDVEVSLDIVNLEDEVIDSVSTVEQFDRDEQKNVFMDVTPGPNADLLIPEAKPV